MFAAKSMLLLLVALAAVYTGPCHAISPDCYSMKQWATRVSTTKIDCVSGPAGQTIPAELSNLQQLEHVDLCGRGLAGTVPEAFEYLKKLTHLALCNNALTGELPELGVLPLLEYLDVSNNALNQSTPQLEAPNLSTIRFENNRMSGAVPETLAEMTLLQHLSMENNYLTGTLPSEIYAFTNLTKLTLAGNRMHDVTPLAADWDRFNSDVAANTSVSPYLRNGEDCTTDNECANFRCASATKKCCGRDRDGLVCESDVCRGNTGLTDEEGYGECGRAWYTDFLGQDGLVSIHSIRPTYQTNTTVPDEVFTLTQLTALELSGSGAINGLSALTNLRHLTISSPSEFSGEVNPLSPSLTSLSNLEYFESGYDRNAQTLNVSLAEAWTNLEHFSMYSAEMAPFVSKLSKLTSLELTSALDTTWPADFGASLPSLESFQLYFATNLASIPDDAFVGTTALKSLELSYLYGLELLPASMWTLGTLTELAVRHGNTIGGSLPNLSGLRNLEQLAISRCPSLTGPLPDDIATLTNLEFLAVEHLSNLNGTIVDSIGDLNKLTYLSLNDNLKLSGSLPSSMSSLSKLTALNLQRTAFTGALPSFSGMHELTAIVFFGNSFDSLAGLAQVPNIKDVIIYNQVNFVNETFLPDFNLPALTSLHVSNNNNFKGNLQVDAWKLPQLRALNIGSNNDVERGPWPLLSGFTKLVSLNLDATQYEGTFPNEWGFNLPKLATAYLFRRDSQVHFGTIPSSFGRLSDLTFVGLPSLGLTGTLPTEFSLLSKLTYLNLGDNALTGTLPDFTRTFSDFDKGLFLHDNAFNGTLPIINNLDLLHTEGNSFEGTIPSEYFTYSNLRYLGLNYNSLTGTLPDFDSNGDLIDLSRFQSLQVRNNALSGTLPAWATKTIQDLSIDDNMFSGTIPNPPASQTLARRAYLDGGNRWVGGIPGNMRITSQSSRTDVIQNTTWDFLASGESCSSPDRKLGKRTSRGRRLADPSEMCTAGDNMCAPRNDICCARIGKDQQQCSTGYCAPLTSANPGACARSCKRGGGDGSCPAVSDEGSECITDRCLQGNEWCSGSGDLGPFAAGSGDFGVFAVCCGEHGIDDGCVTERANALAGNVEDNWCMRCTGANSVGDIVQTLLTGCSLPEPPNGDGTLFTGVEYMRCRLDNANDNNTAAMTNDTLVSDANLKYLSLSGSQVSVSLDDLAEKYNGLVHLEIIDTDVSGMLLSSNAVSQWRTQLTYLNVSTSASLCDDDCLYDDLSVMSKLSVLDMSHMELSLTSEFAKIGQLTGLTELYLNNNPLTSLPANVFDGLTSLTKLRIGETLISEPLPDFLYELPGFDCDVEQGTWPDGRWTAAPTTSAPTYSVPSESPTSLPTSPTSLPTSTPTGEPSTGVPTRTHYPSSTPTKSPSGGWSSKKPTRKPTKQPTKKKSSGSLASPTLMSSVIAAVVAVCVAGLV